MIKGQQMDEENYTIYKVENKDNGMVYIGATTRALNDRKQEHVQRAYNNSEKPLHQAIYTYGEDAFTWDTIDTATTNNELAEKEGNYIYEYSKETEIYNASRGGEIPKEIYQYDVYTLKLLAKYPNLTDASSTINSTKKALSNTCLSVNQFLGGYYWSYQCNGYYIPNSDKRKKQVYQFTLDGDFIKAYSSVNEAYRATNINKTSIAKVCRKERNKAGGYFWQYI